MYLQCIRFCKNNFLYIFFFIIVFIIFFLFFRFNPSFLSFTFITNYLMEKFIVEGVTFTTNPVFKNKSSPTFKPINNYYVNSKISQDFDPDSVITTFS